MKVLSTSETRSQARKGARPIPFRATNLDVFLATLLALGLPVAARALFTLTGEHALAGLLLYYGVCCLGIVWWRKRALGYGRPKRWPWLMIGAGILVDLAITFFNVGTLPDSHAALPGFLLTLLIWVPLNSALEQLAWVYVLDAWRTRWRSGVMRWVGFLVGVVLMLALIALIHVRFWLLLLPASTSGLVFPLSLCLTAAQIGLYYRSGSMWATWFIHLLSDLQLVVLAHYSLLPHL